MGFASARSILAVMKLITCLVFVLAAHVVGSDWPQFRGPGGLGLNRQASHRVWLGQESRLEDRGAAWSFVALHLGRQDLP